MIGGFRSEVVSVVVYHLLKVSGKSGWKVNGTHLFGSFHWKISGSNRTSEKPIFLDGIFQAELHVVFSSKPSLMPVSCLNCCFAVNGTGLFKW